ncbi:MAG TPA: hypothetical protein VJN63_01280 [Thermoplasmata archaeon]|nr:hypothetical protein [Thermoplasmata archaeon]
MTKVIRQTVYFDAPPPAVFEALMRRVGGAFSVWGGYATGKTLRLEKDRVVV